jgi:hypothetical protein
MNMFCRASAVLATFGFFATPVLAEDLVFTLNNFSALDLVEFYTSPAETNDWEEDILGENILAPGMSGEVLIADGRTQCTYDLLFVMSDGQELEDTVNMCELASYTLQ